MVVIQIMAPVQHQKHATVKVVGRSLFVQSVQRDQGAQQMAIVGMEMIVFAVQIGQD